MVEFNESILASLIFDGYLFILYVPFPKHALLVPTKQELPDEIISDLGIPQIAITDPKIVEMSNGNIPYFTFYVSDKYLLPSY